MKRLLLIGGIISMVLPAVADTDLTSYHLVNDGESATCSGPEGYTGFEAGSVTMSPFYVKTCEPGQYYNATSATPVSNHPVWVEDSEHPGTFLCKNPVTDETVSGISSAEACAAAVLDYYYIDACAEVGNGKYIVDPGEPDVTGGYLKSQPADDIKNCPSGYNDGSDTPRSSAARCYKFCGDDEETHKTVQASVLNALNATDAEYDEAKAYNNGTDVCTVNIAANGCRTGYTYVNLAGSANSQFYKCDEGESQNCANTNVPEGEIEPGHWVVVNVSGALIYGTMAFESGTCNATVTHVKVGNSDKAAYTFGPINVGTGTSATDCFSIEAQMALGQGIAAHYTNGVATNYTFCMPNVVNITWKDKTLAPDDPARTCTYGGTLNFPDAPEKENYTFKGWTVGEVETTVEP